jgi:cytochrome bd-type quinol oxidase subunit 2
VAERPVSAPRTGRWRGPSGPGRVLVVIYAIFALAASARAGYQIATRFDDAPLAYLLSAFAAAVYILATIALAHDGRRARKVATVGCSVELCGVVVVGATSLALPEYFPDATVWSHFGSGYLLLPLVLPILGLWWLHKSDRGYHAKHGDPGADQHTIPGHRPC